MKNLRYPLVPVDLIHGSQVTLSLASGDRLQSAGPEAPAQEAQGQVPLFRPRDPGEETKDARPLFRPRRADDVATPKLFRRRED